MDISGIYGVLLAGIVIGALGRPIIPGRQPMGWLLAITLGLLGAFVGGLLAERMGLNVWWRTLGIQAIFAALPVLTVGGLQRRNPRPSNQ